MFLGHYAPALVIAGMTRRPRLGPLFLAAQLIDAALFLLMLAGVEHVGIVPGLTAMSPFDLWDVRWTHSLVGTLGWAAGFTIVVKLLTRDARAAWIAGAVAASHWFLDLLVHPPDLTLAGVGTRHGLALYDHPYLAMPLELLAAFLALAFYLDRTRAIDWRGRWTPALLAVVALGMQLALWFQARTASAAFEAPSTLPLSALAGLTIVTVLAWWTGDLRVLSVKAEQAEPLRQPSSLPDE